MGAKANGHRGNRALIGGYRDFGVKRYLGQMGIGAYGALGQMNSRGKWEPKWRLGANRFLGKEVLILPSTLKYPRCLEPISPKFLQMGTWGNNGLLEERGTQVKGYLMCPVPNLPKFLQMIMGANRLLGGMRYPKCPKRVRKIFLKFSKFLRISMGKDGHLKQMDI